MGAARRAPGLAAAAGGGLAAPSRAPPLCRVQGSLSLGSISGLPPHTLWRSGFEPDAQSWHLLAVGACWLADVWAAVYPGNRPPASFAVGALADTRLWRPANPVLWLRLRLFLLDVLWQAARCPDRASGSSPAALMASIVGQATADMRLDWLRATMPATALAAACSAWLTGADQPAMASPLEEFAACWCHRDRLCGPLKPATMGLDIRWSAVWPVPSPGRPPDVAVQVPPLWPRTLLCASRLACGCAQVEIQGGANPSLP